MPDMKLRIELPDRPSNAVMSAFLVLLTLVFGDPEKELEFEEGGRILTFEDSAENVNLLYQVVNDRSWNDARFSVNRSNAQFAIGISAFRGEENWSKWLNIALGQTTSITIVPC
jgi:hypothetical protein